VGVRSALADRLIRVGKSWGGSEPAAMAQAARDVSQMTMDHKFAPGEPVGPYDGYSRHTRQMDFQTGYNIATRPRTHERVSFDTLRGLIDSYDVAQICIWHKIDTLRGVRWKLLPADNYKGDVEGAINLAAQVMRKPDGIHGFKTWFGKWWYDLLVYDAAPLYRMRNRAGKVIGLMPFDGTCYSDDTEVLTRAGWKRFADADISRDEFATRNQKTKAFEWQAATHYTEQDWAGREPLYRFHSRSYDLLVTPNHRMLVTGLPDSLSGHQRHLGEAFVPAEVLAEHFTTDTFMPATSVWTGTPISEFRLPPVKRGECVTMSGVREARKARGWSQAAAETAAGLTHQTYWSAETGHQVELSTAQAIRCILGDAVTWEVTGSLAKIDAINGDDFAAFMGMWLSEGSLTTGRNFVHISQRRKSKGYQEFRDLLVRILGTEPGYSGDGWRFKSAALVRYLQQFGHAPDKFIPAEILDASAEQLAIFWRFYMLGDGCYEPGGRQRIITASKRMADGLQEVAQKIGFQASVIERKPHSGQLPGGRTQISPVRPSYAVTLRTTRKYRVQHVDRVPYDGKVYCVTVPNETLYVRRNGQPSWCGNTLAPLLDYWGNPPAAPAEAYVQYVNGLPWNWLTRDDVIYEPFRAVNNSPYGKAPIESIMLNANTDLRFQLRFLQYFTDGNIPEAFAAAPETWSPDQIEQWQGLWDSFMYGQQERKSQIRWMPGGSTIMWSNEREFSDAFSLFMMRKTCACLHTVPTDLGFTETSNYSTGESQADVAHKVGELPGMEYGEEIFSRFIYDDLQLPLKFEWDRGEDQDDRLVQAQADQIYVEHGVIGASELREMRFGLPEPEGQAVPRYIFTTRAGPVPLNSLFGVAGKIDPLTAAPEPGTELPREAFTEVPGVIPNPPLFSEPLAEEEFGPSAIPPAPPPQPSATPEATDPAKVVAKEDASAGITADTGLYS
jgi:DNA-binding XRE family transcriptional regulator